MDVSAERQKRRVYADELRRRTGWGNTWLRHQELAGKIPPARRDPGGRRKFWFDDEADAIVRGAVS